MSVKRIFREFLEGSSLLQIGKGLEADGILTAVGKPKWRSETIRKILKNEKYMGDALLQKTYTVDCLTKKRVINNGIVPQYYVENSHEAIIPREIYMQVQEELVRRAKPFKKTWAEKCAATAASMRFQASSFAAAAGSCTGALPGTTATGRRWCGGA